MESYSKDLERIFAALLAEHHRNMPLWHYGITMKGDNRNSLSSLLNISRDHCMLFLEELGLISKFGNTDKVKISRQKWEDFIINQNIGTDIYFEVTKVTKVPTGNRNSEYYYGYWIGLGHKKSYKTNPHEQFKRGRASPPRKTSKLKKYSVELQNLIIQIERQRKDALNESSDGTNVDDSNRSCKNNVSYKFPIFQFLHLILHLKM